jgi:hypothetical protein
MDANMVKTFCDTADTAAQLLLQLGEYASAEQDKRSSEDNALVRQLGVATGAP